MNAPLQGLNFGTATAADSMLEIPLIPAEYDTRSSGECTLQVINDLKRIYQQRNFSHSERFGTPDPLAEAVLRDLGNAYDSAVLWLNRGQDGDHPPRLESCISLKMVAG